MNAGTQQQTQDQNQLNANYQQWYNGAYSPYQQLGVLQSALSGALGNGAQGVSTSTQSGGNNTAALIGGGAALGGGLLKAFGS
jgi:PBP1b-binding outer membrane lipoprotein LpoB